MLGTQKKKCSGMNLYIKTKRCVYFSNTLDAWAYQRGIEFMFIRPGKPVENILKVLTADSGMNVRMNIVIIEAII